MRIDGRLLADTILHHLKETIAEKNLSPHLAIIVVGDNPASRAYVRQKESKAKEIGAKVTIWNYKLSITNEALLQKIEELNRDLDVNGIIIQRPLPEHIDAAAINQAVIPTKDIDAFHTNSLFENPLVKAVYVVLEYIYKQTEQKTSFHSWLHEKDTVILGKGETGGGPIISSLEKHGDHPQIIDRSTTDPKNLLKTADIIISAVGKKDIVTKENIKEGAILISVGQYKDTDDKFYGDYTDSEVSTKAAFYTPTPGGVGPLTVACLLENLIKAAIIA